MSGSTGKRNDMEALFAIPELVDDFQEFFNYLLDGACVHFAEQRRKQIHDHYVKWHGGIDGQSFDNQREFLLRNENRY